MSGPHYCCPECFDDRHLCAQLMPALSRAIGVCSYCGATAQPLVEPIELREQFELIVGIYKRDPDGKTLVEFLKEDWKLFERLDSAHAKELLSDILDDGEIVRAKFKPVDERTAKGLADWQNLRVELMHSNRYFPNTSLDLDVLRELLPHLLIDEDDVPKKWYRARIQASEAIIAAAEMGAPPPKLASHGRANPAGIPYLYVASAPDTAICEVRPHGGDFVSVAEFELEPGLKIVDLRHPRKAVSPFMLTDSQAVAKMCEDVEFLERLGEELTRPILPKSAAYDYIPSQYLCEFAKKCRFDGVMYRSSVDGGVNLAVFDPSKGKVLSVSVHSISRVTVQSQGV